MNKTHNPNLKHNAQTLRKNMTKEERRLWYDFLKILPQTVNRQKVIGRYIADFCCAGAKLVIELDGSQHYCDEGKQNDLERDACLISQGLTVLRYTNLDIQQNFEGGVRRYPPAPRHLIRPCGAPSPQGEGYCSNKRKLRITLL